ncbi:hypothetical protein GO730_39195 [Spirosoma sp. HMF3257]|uniref:Uncharacterized protein n=1 Tax=Spirosoma telluris TaxID=2183553 RepID=A0A327NF95_9BACT|nr:hypothetical protein [Spirosoma telluris]RAI72919.1 hypothetical protein HMF3257_39130 [Spirosoma telluris]
MKTGLIHTTIRRKPVYYKLKRQVVAEFQSEIAQANGWDRDWLHWKRGITLQMRYNNLLFSNQPTRHRSLTKMHG